MRLRKTVLLASASSVAIVGLVAYLAVRRQPHVQMERYAPASVLAFLEVDSLGGLLSGLTHTQAWQELAPVMGLSAQLRQIGLAADLIGRTGLGPDEAVVAARAQYAVAVTGLEADSGATDEGPYVHFRPRFCIIIETHASPETAARLVRERAQMLAERLYSSAPASDTAPYQDTELVTFHGPAADRKMIAASRGSLVLIANDETAIKSCLDATAGRVANLAENSTLKELRPQVDSGASVFAFLTETGVEKLSRLGPAIISSRFTTDPERIGAVASLFGHLSRQAITGVLYGSEFSRSGVVDRYLTVLSPSVGAELSKALKPASRAELGSLGLVPPAAEDFTILNIEGVGELPERALKRLAPRLDVVAGLALREFVIGYRKQLGLTPEDSVGEMIGGEVAFVKFNQSEPIAMVVGVRDSGALAPFILRYLSHGGSSVSTEQYNGVEISRASGGDGRAAAFYGDYLILGTRDQVTRIIDARAAEKTMSTDGPVMQALAGRPPAASIVSARPREEDAAEMMLAISKILRTTDGSPDLLQSAPARAAVRNLAPSVSYTEFRPEGVYTETRSAAGNFSLLASMIDRD